MSIREEIATLVQDDELVIRQMSGGSDRLFLVFTGVRHGVAGMPLDEFVGTASAAGRNHVLFVSDMLCSWYSREGLTERIRACVDAYVQENGIRDIVAVGNSMGGYGAVLFSQWLPISRVIAFVPQVSMDPEVLPQEPRWSEFRANFGPNLAPSLAGCIAHSKARIYMVFGANDRHDRRQAALLQDAPNLTVFSLPKSNHDSAITELKSMGRMTELVRAMVDEPPARVEALMAEISQARGRSSVLDALLDPLRQLGGRLRRKRSVR